MIRVNSRICNERSSDLLWNLTVNPKQSTRHALTATFFIVAAQLHPKATMNALVGVRKKDGPTGRDLSA